MFPPEQFCKADETSTGEDERAQQVFMNLIENTH
jgi:hypothetical protein